jgi:hypothetical protein
MNTLTIVIIVLITIVLIVTLFWLYTKQLEYQGVIDQVSIYKPVDTNRIMAEQDQLRVRQAQLLHQINSI